MPHPQFDWKARVEVDRVFVPTIEDLYQAFKARLIEELLSPELRLKDGTFVPLNALGPISE